MLKVTYKAQILEIDLPDGKTTSAGLIDLLRQQDVIETSVQTSRLKVWRGESQLGNDEVIDDDDSIEVTVTGLKG